MLKLSLAVLCSSLACIDARRVLIGQTFTADKAASIQVDKASFNSYDDYIKKVGVVQEKDVESSFKKAKT